VRLEWRELRRDRLGSAGGVTALHALMLYLLMMGLGVHPGEQAREALKMFSVTVEPPPPPIPDKPEPVRKSTEPKPKDPEGAASPANVKNTPTEIVVPKPKIVLPVPPPIPAAPAAGQGSAPAAGAAPVPGPGTGRGGFGNGLGSGSAGDGTGGGGGGLGAGAPPVQIRGRITDRDYPPRAVRARASGTVHLRFVIAPTGRVSECRVTRSSGNGDLDRTTCDLIIRRFIYRPARDGYGHPIPYVMRGEHEWELGPEPPPIDVDPVPEEVR
jgi:protein TonB